MSPGGTLINSTQRRHVSNLENSPASYDPAGLFDVHANAGSHAIFFSLVCSTAIVMRVCVAELRCVHVMVL